MNDIQLNFEPIINLDNLENQFNSAEKPFFTVYQELSLISKNIEIVNITATSKINENVFFREDIEDVIISIKKIEDAKSDIEKYSKIITLNKDFKISGRLFQSGKLMIYSKNIDVDIYFNSMIKEINRVYDCNLQIIDTCMCLICQFQLGFKVDYTYFSSLIQRNPKLNTGDFVIDIYHSKIKKGCNFLFYVIAEDKYKFSFTIFSTGKIQARCNGNKDVFNTLIQYCDHISKSLYLIRENIETIITKKRHRKNIYNLTRKSSNIQLFCFGFCPNSKGILSSFHLAFSKTNFP